MNHARIVEHRVLESVRHEQSLFDDYINDLHCTLRKAVIDKINQMIGVLPQQYHNVMGQLSILSVALCRELVLSNGLEIIHQSVQLMRNDTHPCLDLSMVDMLPFCLQKGVTHRNISPAKWMYLLILMVGEKLGLDLDSLDEFDPSSHTRALLACHEFCPIQIILHIDDSLYNEVQLQVLLAWVSLVTKNTPIKPFIIVCYSTDVGYMPRVIKELPIACFWQNTLHDSIDAMQIIESKQSYKSFLLSRCLDPNIALLLPFNSLHTMMRKLDSLDHLHGSYEIVIAHHLFTATEILKTDEEALQFYFIHDQLMISMKDALDYKPLHHHNDIKKLIENIIANVDDLNLPHCKNLRPKKGRQRSYEHIFKLLHRRISYFALFRSLYLLKSHDLFVNFPNNQLPPEVTLTRLPGPSNQTHFHHDYLGQALFETLIQMDVLIQSEDPDYVWSIYRRSQLEAIRRQIHLLKDRLDSKGALKDDQKALATPLRARRKSKFSSASQTMTTKAKTNDISIKNKRTYPSGITEYEIRDDCFTPIQLLILPVLERLMTRGKLNRSRVPLTPKVTSNSLQWSTSLPQRLQNKNEVLRKMIHWLYTYCLLQGPLNQWATKLSIRNYQPTILHYSNDTVLQFTGRDTSTYPTSSQCLSKNLLELYRACTQSLALDKNSREHAIAFQQALTWLEQQGATTKVKKKDTNKMNDAAKIPSWLVKWQGRELMLSLPIIALKEQLYLVARNGAVNPFE